MKLSIVIPVYNVEKYISSCLDSVLDQDIDPKDYEIIVVNDGSTDSSLEIAQEYARTNDHIRVIDKDNGGVGSARNLGMDCARGNYMYFIDPDDYIITNCLKELIETCERCNLDILTFLSTTFTSTASNVKAVEKKADFNVSFDDDMLSSILSGEDYVATLEYRSEVWWYLINREFLKSLGIRFVEGQYLEDAAFTLELFLEARRMAHLRLDAYRHRVTSGSAMTSKEPAHYLKIIRDLQYAASAFGPILKTLENRAANPHCVARVKARQESFVFFSMVRMLKSDMSYDEVKYRMHEMISIDAYPMTSFIGKDYNGIVYKTLTKIFNSKRRFYVVFQLVNPILKIRNKFRIGFEYLRKRQTI
jgi:glycosyltransferase involved in cell wall biosynthesis